MARPAIARLTMHATSEACALVRRAVEASVLPNLKELCLASGPSDAPSEPRAALR